MVVSCHLRWFAADHLDIFVSFQESLFCSLNWLCIFLGSYCHSLKWLCMVLGVIFSFTLMASCALSSHIAANLVVLCCLRCFTAACLADSMSFCVSLQLKEVVLHCPRFHTDDL